MNPPFNLDTTTEAVGADRNPGDQPNFYGGTDAGRIDYPGLDQRPLDARPSARIACDPGVSSDQPGLTAPVTRFILIPRFV